MQWEIDVDMFKNTVMLQQVFFAWGLMAVIFGAPFAFIDKWDSAAYTFFHIVCGLWLAVVIVMSLGYLIFYGGQHRLEFLLDSDKIISRPRQEQKKKNIIIHILAIILGIAARNPAAVGAGLVGASTRAGELVRWALVKKVKYKPQSHAIILSAGIFQKLMIFCTKENYAQAAEFVKERLRAQ